MHLLLFSNSTNAGEKYLNYTLPYINSFLGESIREALFIPYAGISVSFDAYYKMVDKQLKTIAIRLNSIHRIVDKKHAIQEARCIITGGGNTFYLLKLLQNKKLMQILASRVKNGTPYIGWSAGSNLACPTIRTTNDMPIVQPKNFDALNLIPFQINPHFTDFKQPGHAGETREMRIEEFILVNRQLYVVGLREGTLLHIDGAKVELIGNKSCRIFRNGHIPREINPGENLNFLMQ